MFIIIEGIDGTGKSTLQHALAAMDKNSLCVRDPGGTVIGDSLRRILLDPANTAITPLTETLLYCASRAQLLGEVILPHLTRGGTVISDRFYFSTLAYQGVLDLLPKAKLRELVLAAAGEIAIDLAILLDAPAGICFRRINRAPDRMEQRGVEYLEKVRQEYLALFAALPENKKIIVDATASPEQVRTQVLAMIAKYG